MSRWPTIPDLPPRKRTPLEQEIYDLLKSDASIETFYRKMMARQPKSEVAILADKMRAAK